MPSLFSGWVGNVIINSKQGWAMLNEGNLIINSIFVRIELNPKLVLTICQILKCFFFSSVLTNTQTIVKVFKIFWFDYVIVKFDSNILAFMSSAGRTFSVPVDLSIDLIYIFGKQTIKTHLICRLLQF